MDVMTNCEFARVNTSVEKFSSRSTSADEDYDKVKSSSEQRVNICTLFRRASRGFKKTSSVRVGKKRIVE